VLAGAAGLFLRRKTVVSSEQLVANVASLWLAIVLKGEFRLIFAPRVVSQDGFVRP
jgi:hypothetical protein